MNDDLTPAEQARAARWRVGKSYCIHVYCGDRPVATFLDPGDALDAVIARNAYLDPPGTVESLRAERDAARIGAKGWEHQVVEFCRFWLKARDDLDAANDTIARLRATHTEAEAAWERCKRQPRVWRRGAQEPEGVSMVRDKHGAVWSRSNSGVWYCGVAGNVAWSIILFDVGPLIEVLP